jgi:hypothetical protein
MNILLSISHVSLCIGTSGITEGAERSEVAENGDNALGPKTNFLRVLRSVLVLRDALYLSPERTVARSGLAAH